MGPTHGFNQILEYLRVSREVELVDEIKASRIRTTRPDSSHKVVISLRTTSNDRPSADSISAQLQYNICIDAVHVSILTLGRLAQRIST